MNDLNFHLKTSEWVSCDQYFTPPMPHNHWNGLLFQGSFTEHLRKITKNKIEHRLKFAGWAHPNIEECLPLSINPHNRSWIREIEWVHRHSIWVFARVIIPEETALIQEASLTKIGETSLGQLLFSDPDLIRSPFEICRIPYNHIYRQIANAGNDIPPKELWARRSIFHFHKKPLMVIEVFKPEYFDFFEK